MPIKLELQGVSKRYVESTAAVSGLSCQVEEGQFTVVLGPSGCGANVVTAVVLYDFSQEAQFTLMAAVSVIVVLVNLGAVWAVQRWMREGVTV